MDVFTPDFDVDSLGKIRNIVILSPENIGFGFTEAVKKIIGNATGSSFCLPWTIRPARFLYLYEYKG